MSAKIDSASEEPLCLQCGASLEPNTPEGLCPRCLLQLVLAPSPAAGAAPESPLKLGEFADYELLSEIGHGGMGVVYRARQKCLGRIVALKMLLGGQFADPSARARFQSEAEIAAQLQHPNIVTIHEVGEHDHLPFFTMDYVEGRSLAEVARDKPLTPAAAAGYLSIIARAIAYAHEQRVLHRDLKPSNILIDGSDQPRITDFGLAKRLIGSTTSLTLTGEALGSPNFMPPEQAAGKHKLIGPASDVYGLGAILYYLVTSRPPFVADNLTTAIRQVQDQEPVSPRMLNPGVPKDLETICLKCLQKEPPKRYQTAGELADELDRFRRGEPILARPVGPMGRTWRWCRRRPQTAALTAALVILGVTGLSAVLFQWQRTESMRVKEASQRARAEGAFHKLQLNQAAKFLTSGRAAEGVALLAARLRSAPRERMLAAWLATELTSRNFPFPVLSGLEHERECTYAEFSPDGRLVLTVARDNAARVWCAETGQLLSAPMPHDPAVVRGDLTWTSSKPLEACFSPDGKLVATASVDRTARIWEARTGVPRTDPLPHPAGVNWVRFSPDGRWLATACQDGVVRLWNPTDGQPLGPAFPNGRCANSVEFSHNGVWIVVADEAGMARVWEVQTGKLVGKPLPHSDMVKMAEFSADDQKVLTASSDSTARIWSVTDGSPVGAMMAHQARVQLARFSPDGRWVATASADGTARLWDASTGTPVSDALPHRGALRWIEFSPEGQRLVTASEDRTAQVWSVATGDRLLEPIHHRSTVWSARFSPDGKSVVTASADGTAQVWDAICGSALGVEISVYSRGLTASWSPEGARLLTVGRTARIWETATGLPPVNGVPEVDTRDGQFSPSGELFAVGTGKGTVRVRDGHTCWAVSPPLRHLQAVTSVEFSPDESSLLTASEDGTACVWDARSGTRRLEPLQHPAPVRRATFAPDGTRLATACEDGRGRVWDAKTGSLQWTLTGHRAELRDIRFNEDGHRVLTVSADMSVRVWDVRTGQRVGPPLQHPGHISQAVFAPGSGDVVTASHDWKIRVWDPVAGGLVGEPLPHDGVVSSLDLRGDGVGLLATTQSGSMVLWHDYRRLPFGSSLPVSLSLTRGVFSPDGLSAIAIGPDHLEWIVRFPHLGKDLPDWLPDLAEAIAGQALTTESDFAFVPAREFLEIRHRINQLPTTDATLNWAQWLVSDKTRRPANPDGAFTLEEYAFNLSRISMGSRRSLARLRQGLCRVPYHAGLLAWYGLALLHSADAANPSVVRESEWCLKKALEMDPRDPRAVLEHSRMLNRRGDWTNAAPGLELVERLGAKWPFFLHSVAGVWEARGEIAAADRVYRQMIDSGMTNESYSAANRRGLIRLRAQFLDRQGRLAEARTAQLESLNVPARDPVTTDMALDLSACYNAALEETTDQPGSFWRNLSQIPKGRQVLDGVEFDIRGRVLLAPHTESSSSPSSLPGRIDAIPIHRVCRRIHFLHSTEGPAPDGTTVAQYQIHLADGRILTIPIVYGTDVVDWVDETDDAPTRATVAWQGRCPGSTRVRVFHTVSELPLGSPEVLRLDFVSAASPSRPFLIAVTLE